MRIYYSVTDLDDVETTEFELGGQWDISYKRSQRIILERCAHHFCRYRQGTECEWPLEFVLHDGENGPKLAKATIEMELRASFYVHPTESL